MVSRLITIEKEYVLEKLYSLVQLCERTDIPATEILSDQLFDGRLLSAQHMFDRTEQEYGLNDHFDLSELMRQANKLWKIMTTIQNGAPAYKVVLENELENFIKQGQKINAIKHYRNVMEKKFGKVPTLRASKDYIDSLQSSLNKI